MQTIAIRLPAVMSLLLCASLPWSARAADCDPVSGLTPFLDPLPIPSVARAARTNLNYTVPVATNLFYGAVPEYDMPMAPIQHQFHRDLPPVEVWAYAGSYPGPTFDVVTNQPILVNWINHLPAKYPSWLPIDTNFHGVPDQSVRTVVHLHGGTSLPRYDGHPENWFRTGQSDQYFYGNLDPDGDGQTQWYHDHAVGVTGMNVYAGLAGFYFLRSPGFEDRLNLPKGQFEIPLVFQDREIQTNCPPASLKVVVDPRFGPIPWCSLAVVNGKVTPYLEVEPRRYRFRALNGSNFRTYGLNLSITDLAGIPITGTPLAPPFNVIGSEDGFLQRTVNISGTDSLTLMSGERSDFIIDFTGLSNRVITMKNLISEALDVPPFGPFITNLMQFRVTLPLSSPDTTSVPDVLSPDFEPISNKLAKVVRTRNFTLDMSGESPFPGPPFIQGSPHPDALINLLFFHDPVTEFPHAGDTEIWNIINLSNEAHPFHVHLTDFHVIDRVRFAGWIADFVPPPSVTNYIQDRTNGVLRNLTNYVSVDPADRRSARPFESGPKDTVQADAFSVTRIVMTWPTNSFYYNTFYYDSGSGLPTHDGMMVHHETTAGTYVYHCHILAHEDNDMMRPFQLLPPYQPSLEIIRDPTANPAGNNHFKLGFQGRPNESYTIQSASEAPFLGWLDLPGGPIQGNDNFVEITPPSSTDSMRFYRIDRHPAAH